MKTENLIRLIRAARHFGLEVTAAQAEKELESIDADLRTAKVKLLALTGAEKHLEQIPGHVRQNEGDGFRWKDERLERELAELKADMGLKLHRRKCWACQTIHWHVDTRTPWVCCPICGSQDTRRVKE